MANVQVLFFGRYRDVMGHASLELELELELSESITLKQLLELLGQKYPQADIHQFQQKNSLYAINQQLAELDATISAGDEIAFMPPVTGG